MNLRWDATRYNKSKQIRIFAIKQLLEWSNYQFAGDENILDVGCGNGIVDEYLCNEYPKLHILGIDSDREMITNALSNCSAENLSFKLVDAREIDSIEQFNLVISTACLHWVKEQDKVLAGIYKSLKPGGQALFTIYPKQPYLWEALDKVTQYPKWQNYFLNFNNPYYFYNDINYADLAQKAGFSINKISILRDDYGFSNQQEAEGMFASWLPHLQNIPKQSHNIFMNEVSEAMLIMMIKMELRGFHSTMDYH